mmetsp:Transcript_20891/g.32298  ORF Transcript_20891/g.32298 Transcript_20891/m.32298 type:complete len:84 (+) Transcript_20891:2510-2761(+)
MLPPESEHFGIQSQRVEQPANYMHSNMMCVNPTVVRQSNVLKEHQNWLKEINNKTMADISKLVNEIHREFGYGALILSKDNIT